MVSVVAPETLAYVGRSLPRVEDERFLTGQGQYLGDLSLPGMAHIAILRSPLAHARLMSIDTAAALALPGVIDVITGEDLRDSSNPLSHLLPMPTIKALEWYALAVDKVRFVGEPIVAVVAEDRYLAEDALELIEVRYEELAPVVDTAAGLEAGAPLLYEEWGDNVFLSAGYSTGDLDGAFASADGVLQESFRQHRIVGLPLEGHGALGVFDPSTKGLTLYASSQQPHNLRTVISDVTGLSEAGIRVIAPDMGGGFGNKQHFMREECLVALLAMRVRRPVRWLQDRQESFTSSVHSREQVHEVEVAYRSDGRILALRARIVADVGVPVLYFTGAAPALVTTSLMTGVYDIPNYEYDLQCVATNKCPIGAYRGFGQPQAFFTIERVMDLLAERLGLDPADVRRRNQIPDEPRPFASPTGALYDVGSFRTQLDVALERIDYEGVRARQVEARRDGRMLGIGMASMVESTAPNLHAVAGRFGGFEMAMIAVQPDGHVNVRVGTKSQGQGHATSLAQVAADALGLPVGHITVEQGDTAMLPYGMGTWGSRSAVMGGAAVIKAAAKVREKMTAIAAAMLQTDVAAITLQDGMFRAGEAELPAQVVAQAAYLHTFLLPPGMSMGLIEVVSYDPGNTSSFPDEQGRMNVAATYASAAAAVVVEVDPNTGHVRLDDVVIVHDCGTMINPMIVEGQVLGAFAQAMGAVLLEEFTYGPDGQPLTTTLLDYAVPLAGNTLRPRIEHLETPSPLPGGFRGAGEAAIIVGPAAIANAIADAVAPAGVVIRQTNLGARSMRALLRDAGVVADPLAALPAGVAGT